MSNIKHNIFGTKYFLFQFLILFKHYSFLVKHLFSLIEADAIELYPVPIILPSGKELQREK